jgi:hypothetical protein
VALYERVGTLVSDVRALHILCLRGVRTPTAVASEGGPNRLAVRTRPREGLALGCMVFPSGARWELECGKCVRNKLNNSTDPSSNSPSSSLGFVFLFYLFSLLYFLAISTKPFTTFFTTCRLKSERVFYILIPFGVRPTLSFLFSTTLR